MLYTAGKTFSSLSGQWQNRGDRLGLCSLSFLYLFLPLSLLVYWACPFPLRPKALLLLSFAFYYGAEGWTGLGLMFFVLFSDWMLAGRLLGSRNAKLRQAFVACAVIKNIGIFIGYHILSPHIPLGLGVYCMTSLGYVLDCYHGFAIWGKDPSRVLLMSAFFPKLAAGPIVYYGRIVPQFFSLRVTLSSIGEGGSIFLLGLFKKVILGDSMAVLFRSLHDIPKYEISLLGIWSMLISLSFALYFSLWGFCQMAEGLALMFGFRISENFNNPFLSQSINEFFGRFNSTINRFIRRHVYMPLGGAKGNSLSMVCNIFILSVCMASWFSLRPNILIWGIFLSLFVMIEGYLLPRGWKNIASFFQWLYCAFVIQFSMIFWAGDSLSESFSYLRILFRGAAGLDDRSIYLLVSNYLVIILCCLFALGLPQKAALWVKRVFPGPAAVGEILFNSLLLTAVTAYLL